TGKNVAMIENGEWKTAETTDQSWDFNYTSDTLEVKNGAGRIVLQIRVLPDRVQLQGESWDANGHGWRMVKEPKPRGGGYLVPLTRDHDHDELRIVPIFKYPGERHMGEMTEEGVNLQRSENTLRVVCVAITIYGGIIFLCLLSLLGCRLIRRPLL